MKKPKLKRTNKAHPQVKLEDSRAAALRETLLEVVDNQLREGKPPETQLTYNRLISEGFSDQIARNLIAAVVSREVFDVLKQHQPYNEARYIEALAHLPKMPWE